MFPSFVSVVVVVHNRGADVPELVASLEREIAGAVSDYEIVLVDNCSTDSSREQLEAAARHHADVQVYSLATHVEEAAAVMAGMENCLGDYVILLNPAFHAPSAIRLLIEKSSGCEIVKVTNAALPVEPLPYRLAQKGFNFLFRKMYGKELPAQASDCVMLSRRVVNLILQYKQPHLAFRLLPVLTQLRAATTTAASQPLFKPEKKSLLQSLARGLSVLTFIDAKPLRLVSSAAVLAATANVAYMAYVTLMFAFKEGVAPGWTTLSLQISGMFFFLSLAVAILAEYIGALFMSAGRPLYLIGSEATSPVVARKARLNVVDGA